MKQDYLKEQEAPFSLLSFNEEVSRCLLCMDPLCSKECPAQTDPGRFIRAARFKNYKGSAEIIRENNILGGICARVCPTEKYCQKGCARSGIDKPIDIGRIQRFITDFEKENNMHVLKVEKQLKQKIAIIGSGPGGLSLAGYLRLKGFNVDIYEKESQLGGYLRYGIPSYRLNNKVLDDEIKYILDLGVKTYLNKELGREILLDDLKNKYDVVVLAIGYSLGKIIDIYKNNKYVDIAINYLKEIKSKDGKVKVDDNVIVVGGGDVSMDIATSLKVLGCKNVTVFAYERLNEFLASKKELENARKVNVSIFDGYIPLAADKNNFSFKHRFIDSVVNIKADKLVLAIGQKVNLNNIDINLDNINNYQLKNSNIFVVGDISQYKEKTVVGSVRSAKECANYIEKYLLGDK